MEKLNSTNEVFFEVDSRLLFQLGEQLVSKRSIALAELVKNSYDADATETIIILENVKNKIGGTITVNDNGTGISPEQFKQTWMRIATMDATTNPYSKRFKRQRAGEKGIGRIACRKLAKELRIMSVTETESRGKVRLSAHFKWSSFLPGSDLNKIPVDINIEPIKSEVSTGTELKLINTTEKWTDRDIKRLNVELTDLFSPSLFKDEFEGQYSSKEDPGFEYKLIAPEFQIEEDSLTGSFLKLAWAKLSGNVDEHGNASYILEIQNPLLNKFVRGFEKEKGYTSLRNTSFEIYLFKYTPYFFRDSNWKLNQAALIGRERGGVKIYADTFRVFGYGGEKDDWLHLEADKTRSITTFSGEVGRIASEDNRPALQLFDYRGLFGYVQFERKSNPSLSISINRQSLEDNESLADLTDFVRTGIDFATVVYSDERLKKEKKDFAEKKVREEEEHRRVEEEKKRAEEKKRRAEEEEKRAEMDRKKAEEIARKKQEVREETERIRYEIERELDELWDKITVFEDKGGALNEVELEQVKDLRCKYQQIRSDLLVAKKKEKEAREEAIIESTKAARSALSELKVKISSFEQIKKAEQSIIEAAKFEIEREKKKYDEAMSILRVLASTGTLIFIFTHEIRSFIADITNLKSKFASAIEKLDERDRRSYDISLKHFESKIEMVDELGNFIGITGGNQSRSELMQFFIKPIVDDVCNPFSYEAEKRGIKIINAVPQYIRTPVMYRSEIAALIINLFTNAVKAVTTSNAREIKFEAGEIENDVIFIRCLDTGKGLKKELWEEVFDPFVAYNEPDINFGAGTGLGLKIVKDIVTGYGGDVKFVDPPQGWNTCIEMRLPLVG